MTCVRRRADLTLIHAGVRDLHGVEAHPPLVLALLCVVKHLDAVGRRVEERIHRQQRRVLMTDPGNLKMIFFKY